MKKNAKVVTESSITFETSRGFELSRKRSPFCNQNGSDKAGVEATCRDE